MTPTPLGIVLRHDKTGFTFITREHLKTWEFVHYQTDRQQILCRVAETEPLTEYPVEFLLDSGISPADVAEFCGFDPDEFEYFMTKGVVIGDPFIGEIMSKGKVLAHGKITHKTTKRDFLLSSGMGSETTESTEDTEKTATLCALRVLCG